MLKKPYLKVQNLQYKFLDNDPPPPLELFRKFIRFGDAIRPLEPFWGGPVEKKHPVYLILYEGIKSTETR